MAEYIEREALRKLMYEESFEKDSDMQRWDSGCWIRYKLFENCIEAIPAADVVEIPEEGIEFLSDGYHTFNSLYFQRLVLFAALVKAYKDRAWKSWKHEDGEPCFGGGWFIVGIDTPHGSYTYHYEGKDFDLFECEELPVAKHWDGHTDAHVTRLLSLPDVVERKKATWAFDDFDGDGYDYQCPCCSMYARRPSNFCPNCGAKMDGGQDNG